MSKAYSAKNKTVCQAHEKCTIFNRYVNPPDRRKHSNPHTCYATFCRNCKTFVQRDHLCYIVRGKAAKNFGKTRFGKHLASKDIELGSDDFEDESDGDELDNPEVVHAKPDDLHQRAVKCAFDFECGIDASRYHYPNMVAPMCLDDDFVKEVFRGKECANQLLMWIFKTTTNCTFLSHNGKKL